MLAQFLVEHHRLLVHLGLLAEIIPAHTVLYYDLFELLIADIAILFDLDDVLVDLGLFDLIVVFRYFFARASRSALEAVEVRSVWDCPRAASLPRSLRNADVAHGDRIAVDAGDNLCRSSSDTTAGQTPVVTNDTTMADAIDAFARRKERCCASIIRFEMHDAPTWRACLVGQLSSGAPGQLSKFSQVRIACRRQPFAWWVKSNLRLCA